jgi:Putative beta-barrel porin-2, OmpL-like. bbp2
MSAMRFWRTAKTLALLVCGPIALTSSVLAQSSPSNDTASQAAQENQDLRQLVLQLQKRVEQLERQNAQAAAAAASGAVTPSAASQEKSAQVADPTQVSSDDRALLDYLKGTTVNLTLDGYYAYNFNRPIGRINLLRSYDVSSNSFSLNQATLVFERAPDVAAGRRFGARVDLQYGQATETLQGNAANEPRPQAYRPLFQAYGTYIAPLGSGLTVDFGKWASALGIENNFSKDQMNYSRSFWFNFLPFYHMGFRTSYKLNNELTVGYWLVNGAQQTEDFNGFKSQLVEAVLQPHKTVSWTLNYYTGQEQRDLASALNPGLATLPTQPGLSTQLLRPTQDGRLHILDSYVSWTASPKLTLAAEADYVINRVFEHSAPGHVSGGAAYARYQLSPKVALAARGEYMSDQGGLFSGATQALKESTLTYEYKFADGFLLRTEWRRDFSNRPFFLTAQPNILKKEQNTATLGLVWWWGQKQGAW